MDKIYILLIVLIVAAGIIAFISYKSGELRKAFELEKQIAIQQSDLTSNDLLREDDIKHLPEPVQKYIRYVGAIGKEKPKNFKVTLDGEFRTDPKKGWGKMLSLQYTDLVNPVRLYYMKLNMFGLPVDGLHKYASAKATMLAKIAGLITVVDGKGPEMDEGETVTVFNDMCILAPASLIDRRIEWESIDPLKVKASFNNEGIKISALLYFNEKGELINFVSDDRSYSPTGKTYKKVTWSTPLKDYKDYNGIKLASGGEAVWHFPEGEYSYGRIYVKEIEYNVKN